MATEGQNIVSYQRITIEEGIGIGKEGSRMEGTLDVDCFNFGGSF